ncbi:rRNA-processing protein EFG1-like [Cynara cardunculus var. scolymus]|uniref:rRNA-processing protein EFG1-like n=1 Tax=Cynara cardunculus var. scolymus TaxID=59895 RepID=UPI000D6293BC|nr:rRNA-processing protein EFG1-like [Cynara cardunculus var. scolymus]
MAKDVKEEAPETSTSNDPSSSSPAQAIAEREQAIAKLRDEKATIEGWSLYQAITYTDPQVSSISGAKLSTREDKALAREEEISFNVVGPSAKPTTNEAEVEAPRAEADAEVACAIPTSSEAAIAEEVDAIPRDDDLPITSTHVAADVKDEEDDEEGDEPDLPNSSSDLDGDDDDDDEDDFTIQFQHPTTATKGVALKDFASQGERKEEEFVPERNQGPSLKGKGVAEEGNLKVFDDFWGKSCSSPIGLGVAESCSTCP